MVKKHILLMTALILFFSVSSASAQDVPPDLPSFYAHSMVELIAHQIPPLVPPDLREEFSPDFEAHIQWSRNADLEQIKHTMFEKFERMVKLKEEEGIDARADWFAHVCINWAQFGIDFGGPKLKGKDFQKYAQWAREQPTNVLKDQINIRIEKILDHYTQNLQPGREKEPTQFEVNRRDREHGEIVNPEEIIRISDEDLPKVTRRAGRASMIKDLLKDKTTADILRALPSLEGENPEVLAWQGLDGSLVSELPEPEKHQESMTYNTYPSEKEWRKGITITPFLKGTSYHLDRKTYEIGNYLHLGREMSITSYSINRSLKIWYKNDAVYAWWPFSVLFHVELPTTGDYMIKIHLTGDYNTALKKSKAFTLSYRRAHQSNDMQISYSKASDGSGFVGIISMPNLKHDTPRTNTMRRYSAEIRFEYSEGYAEGQFPFVFRGITITLL